MNTYEIHIRSRAHARELYEVLSECTNDADLLQANTRVDGRSLLGIYALDFARPVTLEAYGASDRLQERLEAFLED